jgi:hypothetical protein
MPDIEASAFATLRLSSVSRAQAYITIFPPRPHWPLLWFDVMETDFSLPLRRGRMKRGTTPSQPTDRLSERLSRGMGRWCLCGVLGAEAGVLTPEVVEEIQSFFRRCIDDLRQRIGGPEAEARAFHVMATLEGGMMLARAYRDIGAFDQATESLA